MTATDLLTMIEALGARLVLLPSGRLKIAGDQVQIERWLGTVAQYEDALIGALRADPDTAAER